VKLLKQIQRIRYSRKSLLFYQKIIKKDDLCFDIGANYGAKSKLFLTCGAKVMAFEPQTSCHKFLDEIIDTNFSYQKCAVGFQIERRKLYLSQFSEIATLSEKFVKEYSSQLCSWDANEFVQVYTLNYLVEKYGVPDFCKIDIEGFEWEVISILSDKIPLIEFEFTHKFADEAVQCIEKLSKMGYQFNYSLDHHPKFEIQNWSSKDAITQIIAELTIRKTHANIFCKLKA
jgi:FkbM family methyltransferase